MDRGILEALAVALYTRHDLDPSEPETVGKLARAELGEGCILRGAPLYGADASLFWLEGQRKIAIRRGLSPEMARHRIGHELAHLELEREGYREDDLEACCDYLGACLMAPAPAVRAMARSFGQDFTTIAAEIGSTETLIALRLAEVRGTPRIVLTPRKIYDRLPEEWVHPPQAELRALERSKRPGLQKTRLKDDPKRLVIDVDDVG